MIQNEYLAYFMICHFNDMIGSVAFLLLHHIVLTCIRINIKLTLLRIELFILCCGLYWEYFTPLYRQSTTTDILDILAYLAGGLIYWAIAGRDYANQVHHS